MASEIAKLAAAVLTNTVKIDDYLQTNNLPSPSFHKDGPIDLKLSADAEAARVAALEASTRLNDLLRGPVELVRPTVILLCSTRIWFGALTLFAQPSDQCGQP